MAIFKKYYSKQSLWTLFLMSALPIHIWTIVLALRDFDWVSERTNSWDAIGVASYGLVFAMIESVFLFTCAALVGLFISNKWGEKKRVLLMSVFIIMLTFWSIFNQFYFLQKVQLSKAFIDFFIILKRPLVALYGFASCFVALSFLTPALFILISKKAEKFVEEGIERLSLLMILYLFLDAGAIIILIARNL